LLILSESKWFIKSVDCPDLLIEVNYLFD
jgi:hypothetical protein